MDTPLPPIPADLWPKTLLVEATRPDGRSLSLEIPSLSERPLLDALSRAVHLNMEGAAKWAARVSTTDKAFPSPREFSRLHADDAARLLAAYTALYHHREFPSDLSLSPEALKASASRAYAAAFQFEKQTQQKPGASYNDGLHHQVQSQQSGQNTGLHP